MNMHIYIYIIYIYIYDMYNVRKRFSMVFQFFPVFQFFCRIGQEQLNNSFLRVSSLHVIYLVYIYICPPKRSSQNLGQNVRETL